MKKSTDLSRADLIQMIARLRGSLYEIVSEPTILSSFHVSLYEAMDLLNETSFDVVENDIKNEK